MDWIKFACIALVVGIIGPLFWLGVNLFEVWFWRSLRRLRASRQAKKSAATHNRLL